MDLRTKIESALTFRRHGTGGRDMYDCPFCKIKDPTASLVITWSRESFICNHGASCGAEGHISQIAKHFNIDTHDTEYKKTYKKPVSKMSYKEKVKAEVTKDKTKYKLLDIKTKPYQKYYDDQWPEIQRVMMIQELFSKDWDNHFFYCCLDGQYNKKAIQLTYEEMTNPNILPYTHFKLNCANKDSEVTRFKYALLESDTIHCSEQFEIIQKLNLPIASVVWSGNKSLHTMVKVDAKDIEEYKRRVKLLYEVANDVGFGVDTQCKNPTRYTRLAGSQNKATHQYHELISLSMGESSWMDWEVNTLPKLRVDFEQQVNNILVNQLFQGALEYDYNQIEDKAEIVSGLIQDGKIFCIGGASKAGKSLLTSRLAMCLSQGDDFFEHQCLTRKVLYFDTELDPDDFKRRKDVIRQNDNLTIILAKNIPHVEDETQLERIKRYLSMIKAAADTHGFQVIIIDCIYKFINENDVKEVTAFVTAIEELKHAGYCVIVVHHTNKAKYEGGEPINHLSGHSNLGRAVDGCLLLLETNTMHEFPDGTRAKHYQIYYTLRSFDMPDPKVVYINKKRQHTIDVKETQIQFNKQMRNSSTSSDRVKMEHEHISKNTPMHEENAVELEKYIEQMAISCGLTEMTIKKKRIPLWQDEGLIKVVGIAKKRRVFQGDKLFGESVRHMQSAPNTDDLQAALDEF